MTNTRTIKDLNHDERTTMTVTALKFYRKNRSQVQYLRTTAKGAISPMGPEMFNPEQWRGIHWNWLNSIIPLGE